jgi:hypothetical protein
MLQFFLFYSGCTVLPVSVSINEIFIWSAGQTLVIGYFTMLAFTVAKIKEKKKVEIGYFNLVLIAKTFLHTQAKINFSFFQFYFLYRFLFLFNVISFHFTAH